MKKYEIIIDIAVIALSSALCLTSCSGSQSKDAGPGKDLSSYWSEDGHTLLFNYKNVPFSLVEMESGAFSMGRTPEQGRGNTPVVHEVLLDGFAIGSAPVSQALWKAVMGGNPSSKVDLDAPVDRVTWREAQSFVRKLSRKTGINFRLPTEAEWEYAARGGQHSLHYVYGGSNTELGQVNEIGLSGVSGVVWQWCQDRYADDFTDQLAINPKGAQDGSERVIRGGSPIDKKTDCVICSRKGIDQTLKSRMVGLRIALSLDKPFDQNLKSVLADNKVSREVFNDANLTPETFTVGSQTIEMIPVKGGKFFMGATKEQGTYADQNEKPVHQVTLDNYKISKFDVTTSLWKAVMGYLPPENVEGSNPVVNVSWYDAYAFIFKLNSITHRTFRLPTEAEWEFAARGGMKSVGYRYSGSDDVGIAGWYSDNSNLEVHPVGKKVANELGLYDMSGNVWQWCQDEYAIYSAADQVNPSGPAEGDGRIQRGGSAKSRWNACRVSNRQSIPACNVKSTFSFRIAL